MSSALSTALTPAESEIRRRIRKDGPVSVADFMAIALAHPEHGYYRTRDPLGAKGDFITAPEISQAFGELIGAWCAVAWQQMGSPGEFRLVELGPGRGTLMADALRATAAVPGFAGAARLHLVETGPALRAAQAEAVAGTGARWHEDLSGVPAGPLILIANEFFDALPVRQLIRAGGGWHERRVGLNEAGDRLGFVTGEAVPDAGAAPDGTIREFCPAAAGLIADIAARLKQSGGAALIVDYGPAHGATGSSLQAVKGHRRSEVLETVGEADLTAHVDFAALGKAAAGAGAAVHGPLFQGELLTRLGIEARTEILCRNADAAQRMALETGRRRLTDADAMGALFKALALTGPGQPAPAGFEA